MGEAKEPPTRLNNFIKLTKNRKAANSTAEKLAKKTCYGQLKMCTPRKTEWPRQGPHDRPRRGTTHHHKRWLFSFICATQMPSIGVRKKMRRWFIYWTVVVVNSNSDRRRRTILSHWDFDVQRNRHSFIIITVADNFWEPEVVVGIVVSNQL